MECLQSVHEQIALSGLHKFFQFSDCVGIISMEKLQASKFYLLGIGNDAKTSKGAKYGFLTGILYLAPANISGREVCPSRSPGCSSACLFTAGRGVYTNVQNARIRKTNLLFSDRKAFLTLLRHDIALLVKKAKAEGFTPCVRLNGTSDLGWEGIAKDIMTEFSEVQFYDYTKVLSRMKLFCQGKFPKNYHLTFSRSESNWQDCKTVLSLGGNVASVFYKTLPATYSGFKVVDGDLSELRFKDGKNVIVGLKAKGKARYDDSGFVIFA